MRKSLLLALLLLGTWLFAKSLNRILATVNGEVILFSDYLKQAQPALKEASKNLVDLVVADGLKGLTAPLSDEELSRRRKRVTEEQRKKKMEQISHEILDSIIHEKLMTQEARKRSLRVTKREIEEGILQVKVRFLSPEGQRRLGEILQGGKPGAAVRRLEEAWAQFSKDFPKEVEIAERSFQEELRKQGLTMKQYLERLQEQVMSLKLFDLEVRSRLAPPPEADLKKFYEENKARMLEPEKVRVRHILIRVSPQAGFKEKASAQRRMAEIRARIVSGEDFADVARAYSEDPESASAGGDLDYIPKGQTTPAFERAAFALGIGELSPIVETEFGYHILKSEGKKAAERKSYPEVKEYIQNFLFAQKQEERYNIFIKTLKDKSTIQINGPLKPEEVLESTP